MSGDKVKDNLRMLNLMALAEYYSEEKPPKYLPDVRNSVYTAEYSDWNHNTVHPMIAKDVTNHMSKLQLQWGLTAACQNTEENVAPTGDPRFTEQNFIDMVRQGQNIAAHGLQTYEIEWVVRYVKAVEKVLEIWPRINTRDWKKEDYYEILIGRWLKARNCYMILKGEDPASEAVLDD